MSQIDRHALQRTLRLQLKNEFPDLELLNWYTQYRELKAAYPDTILLYRLGDFYEVFDDDAKLAAELLDLTLTSKEFGTRKDKTRQRCPMAGMPYHAIERYVGALVGGGYRVAIAEQTSETPSSKSDIRPKSVFAMGIEQSGRRRDIVDREVVRVITPGTVIEPGMLAANQNNYLAALIAEHGRIGLAYADLSTGEFCCAEFAGDRAAAQAQGELSRIAAVEVLVPDDPALRLPGLEPANARLTHDLEFMTKDERELLLPGERLARRVERENTARWAHGHVTGWPSWRWKLQTAADALLQQLRVHSLDGFGLRDKPLAARAAGAVIQYIHETQRGAADQIATLHAYTTTGYMFLDPQTRRNLELLEGSGGTSKGSLVGVLDQTRTPMGARLIRRWLSQPLLEIDRLRARHDGVAYFVDDALLRATVREKLKQIGDMERAVNRVVQGITVATPRDMVRLREALRALPALAEALDGWIPPTLENQEPRTENPQAPVVSSTSPVARDDSWLIQDVDRSKPDNGQRTTDNGQKAQPSLREQREARRRPAARYDDDDLFGEGGWDDEAPIIDDSHATTADDLFDDAPQDSQDALYGGPSVAAPVAAPPPAPPQASSLDPCGDILAFLEQALDDDPPALLGASNYLRAEEGGEAPRRTIRPGFEPKMDEIVKRTRYAKKWIEDLEARERRNLGIRDKGLRVDHNKVFGYYIEVSNSLIDRVPPTYIRKQTVATAERYFTAELKEYETIVVGAQEMLIEYEQQAFAQICAAVAAAGPRLLATARALAEIDVYAGLAEAAVRGRYVRPSLHDDTRLRIVGGRHPVVEQALDEPFVANDTTIDTDTDEILVVTGPNMAGKCLRGDTLIFTDRGLVPIVELMPPEAREGEFTEIACRVQGLGSRREATHFYKGGKQATIRLTTRLGYQIEGTPEHRVWVRNADGSEAWKYLGDIANGDVVAIERQIDLWGTETAINASVVHLLTSRAQQYSLPSEIDEDLAYVMGLLIGDGTLTYRDSFMLTAVDAFIADEFRRIIDRLFGYRVGCKANGRDYCVSSKQIRVFLANLGLGYGQAHEKYVPHSILRAPKHIVVAFLQGLFDTDGSANNRYGGAQLPTASIRLAREVQLLLLNMGIIASLRTKKTPRKPCYLVSIYGADAIAFHQQVGFRLPYKQVRRELTSSVRMPNIGGIPHLTSTLKELQTRIVAAPIKPVVLKKNKSINSIFYTYIPNGRNISYTKLDELITYCHQSAVECSELETLQTQRYFYDPIKVIESGEAEVYDLSVAEDHAYIANGFVSHNSTCLRQVALIVLMAQIGSFVPADAAEVGLADRIFTRIGAQDDIATGRSTFMVEMTETAALLIQSTGRSLIILDEVGRGTSTYDGMAIARAVIEYIHNEPRLGCRTLFATHYHELTELEDVLPRVKNYHMAAVEQDGRVVFLHELRRGGADRSYGIHVAELAGIPRPVIRRASELLADLENQVTRDERRVTGDEKARPAAPDTRHPTPDTRHSDQLSLFDVAPNPVVEMIRRINVNELSPIEALTKLYELQRLANH